MLHFRSGPVCCRYLFIHYKYTENLYPTTARVLGIRLQNPERLWNASEMKDMIAWSSLSDLHANYYLYLRLTKSTKTARRYYSLHSWLRTGEYSAEMIFGTLYIDLRHDITPLSILISHSPPVWWHYMSEYIKSSSNSLNRRSSLPDCWCEACGIVPIPPFSTTQMR